MYYLINLTWTYSDDNHVIVVDENDLKEHNEILLNRIERLTKESGRGYTNLPCVFLSIDDIPVDFEDKLEELSKTFPIHGTIVNAIEITICD